jgi:predicted small metal-binding protein
MPPSHLERATFRLPDVMEASMLKEVTCLCGWVARGTDDEVVEQLTLHAWEDHGVRKTREEILAGAVPVAPDVS